MFGSNKIIFWILMTLWIVFVRCEYRNVRDASQETVEIFEYEDELDDTCQCGVFMSQQAGVRGRARPRGVPEGEPVITYNTEERSVPCGTLGFKNCVSKCLDAVLAYLPKAGALICGAVERDVDREKAFLFIKNCGSEWTPTNFSAGKSFCCVDGKQVQC